MALVVKGGTVVGPWGEMPADLRIENGRIEHLGFDLEPDFSDDVLDATGLYVLPGLVDMHTHFHLRIGSIYSADDFDSGTAAALAGGTTTVVDFVTPDRDEDPVSAIKNRLREAENARTDYSFHLCLMDDSDETLDAMDEAASMGIRGFKVFLAYPDRYMVSPAQLRRIMARARELGALVLVHAEDGPEVERLREEALSQGHTEVIWHARTRPSWQEASAVQVVADAVREVRTATLVVHVSAKEAAQIISDSGMLPLFGETCPQYLWLDETRLMRPGVEAAAHVCSPPLRTEDHMKALWEHISSLGLHEVSTDHCPFMLDLREAPDFTRIPGGLPGVETRFGLLYWGGVVQQRFSMSHLVRLLSTNPAVLSGLYPQKGEILPGSDADLIFFDPNGYTQISVDSLYGRSDHDPYDGLVLPGHIVGVLSRGEVVMDGGEVLAEPGRGRFIERQPLSSRRLNMVKSGSYPWPL